MVRALKDAIAGTATIEEAAEIIEFVYAATAARTRSQPAPIYYLASPYTHADPERRLRRYRAACRAAAYFIERGLIVYSPIAHGHAVACDGRPLATDFEFWQKHCLAMLGRCDGMLVLTLEGWKESRGVQAEIAEAKRLGIGLLHVGAAHLG